jgi:hypothetical protein
MIRRSKFLFFKAFIGVSFLIYRRTTSVISWFPSRPAAIDRALTPQNLDHMGLRAVSPYGADGAFVAAFFFIRLLHKLFVTPKGVVGNTNRNPRSIGRPGGRATDLAHVRQLSHIPAVSITGKYVQPSPSVSVKAIIFPSGDHTRSHCRDCISPSSHRYETTDHSARKTFNK